VFVQDFLRLRKIDRDEALKKLGRMNIFFEFFDVRAAHNIELQINKFL